MANRIAGAAVHGGRFTIGLFGDSTTAGADNCIYDAWPYGVERQFVPIFAAAKLNFSMRNAGHNGGWKVGQQLACFRGILGEEVDVAILAAPYVKVPGETILEFVRRSLLSGTLPFIGTPDKSIPYLSSESLREYARFGVAQGVDFTKTYVDHWWPLVEKHDDGLWGRPDDGLCHIEATRSGSAAVIARNWHPGPIGHQFLQDIFSFWIADAAGLAMDNIMKAIRDSKGSLIPLRDKWPVRPRIEVSNLPKLDTICKARRGSSTEWDRLCGPVGSIPFGPCLAGPTPKWGPTNQTAWAVKNGAPQWGDDNGWTSPWTVNRIGRSHKNIKFGPPEPVTSCRYHCFGIQTVPFTFELNRSVASCWGVDYNDALEVTKPGGWITMSLPTKKMTLGAISICGHKETRGNPTVRLKGAQFNQEFKALKWDQLSGNCATITEQLPAKTLNGELFLAIGATHSRINYVMAE